MYKKKSQVTIFIILGIILLLMAGILIYSITIQKKVPTEPIVEEIPLWAKPIKDYVDNCVREVSVQALTKLGEHGGYIDMNDRFLSGRNFNINVKTPTESDAVSLSTELNQPIAYWWYLQSQNNCMDCYVDSLTPSLEDIEGQINRFVTRELNNCLNDFEDLKKQGFNFNKGSISTQTTIAENGVSVFVNYPLDIAKEDSKLKIENFETRINLNLIEILRVAASITIEEMNNQSMEKILSYVIGAYSGVDTNKLPPIADITHEFYAVSWVKDAVEINLKNILSINTNYIKVNQTKNSEFYGDAYKIYLLNSLEYPTELSADFFYLGWPLYFDITPRSGNMLKANIDRQSFPLGILPPTQTNYYEFFYDVSYPVIVMLTDDSNEIKADFKDGYRFMFALETNIRDNINLLRWHLGQGTIGLWDYSAVDISASSNIKMPLNYTKSLMCDEQQKISADVEIRIGDARTNQPLEEATITFGCGRYTACALGATDSNGFYKGKFPYCVNGYLLIEKEGYLGKAMLFNPDMRDDKLVTVSLEPYKELKAKANVYRMSTPNQCCSSASEIGSGEQIIIMLNKYRDDPVYDQVVTQALVFDNTKTEQTIKLVPGKYEARITYVDNNKYTIPAKCKQICKFGGVTCTLLDPESWINCNDIAAQTALIALGCHKIMDMWLPENPIEMTSVGGATFDATTGYLDISRSDLNNNNVEFYAIRVPDSTCIDENCTSPPCVGMDEPGKIETYSTRFKSSIQPRFS